MASATGFEVDHERPRSTSTHSFIFRLTGLRVELQPRSSYKPSRMLGLTIDEVIRSVSFQSHETLSLWSWEVVSEAAILITRQSNILIQPYEARRFKRRKKAERITIPGDVVFRLCSASTRAGDRYDYEHNCVGFRMYLSFVAQEDSQAESALGGQTISLGIDGQDVERGPRVESNSFQLCLRSLLDLMQSLPPSASELQTLAEKTKDALQSACTCTSTEGLDEDFKYLGEHVHRLLSHMQEPKFSEHLSSFPQTVKSVLKVVGNAAMFLEDCSKHKTSDLADPNSRTLIMEDFDKLLTTMKSSFAVRRDVSQWRLPYSRKQVSTVSAFIVPSLYLGGGSRNETGNPGQEQDRGETKLDKLRNTLKPRPRPKDSLDRGCLGRTRTDLLSNIYAWFDDHSTPNVLWLCGAAGTGKTAISWSLIAEMKRQQRCAGAFFFGEEEDAPSKVWQTLAYEMARFHPAIETEIYKSVTARTNDKLDWDDVQIIFQKLVSDPLKRADALLSTRSPILLIDALEQCKRTQDKSWESLLNTVSQWPSLPPHCKLIITSRPQDNIAKALEGRDTIKRMELPTGEDINPTIRYDVFTYLSHRFTEMRKQDKSIPDNWPGRNAISKLADHTGGIFKWAAVAVDDIQEATGGREKRLAAIMEGGTTTKFDAFDEYLAKILRVAFGDNPSEYFRATLWTITLSKQPLTLGDLEHLLQSRFSSSFDTSLEDMCYKLLPIVSIDSKSKAIKLRHKAYKDYLVDFKRCTLFDSAFRSKTHRKMTISCFRIMQRGLKFNICGFKSSYWMNNQVENMNALTERCIPSYLGYACQYWADHLRGIESTEKRYSTIVILLRTFLNYSLLYWLEALSLLSKSDAASKSLLIAAEWLEVADKSLSLKAADASRFSFTFADVISASAPHIYLSALPFTPPSSLISKRYRGQFPRTIKVLHEDGIKWPAMRFSVSAKSYVHDISIHPDGKKVAAAMSAGIAMVVSMTTGEILFHLSGHGGSVRAIAYGPYGKRIATGCDDKSLRIYESENGTLLFGPFELHSDWIRSVAWFPDGQRIVTGSDDRKVKVVAVDTGDIIYDTALHNDWVRTVLCTEKIFISASDDRTVRKYDASTGATSGDAWSAGKTGYVSAIAISPDNRTLAVGSDDWSIILCNVDTWDIINQPIRGHNGAVRSLAFSTDGQLLASGGDDRTVRLWSVQTGEKFCDPLDGHTSCVNSVKFSPDMKQLVTGGDDHSIRFFDMDSLPVWKNSSGGTGKFRAAIPFNNGDTVLASDGLSISRWNTSVGGSQVEDVLFKGDSAHLTGVRSVSISPDGQLVATSTKNRTVIIWQADTGKILWGPFEGHSQDIYALNFSADSKMVVSGSDDQKVWIWSAETGQSIYGPLNGHTASVRGVCFSPNGKQVASGSKDNKALIWSVESGERMYELEGQHRDCIWGLAYSPNGLFLATASDDRTVVIWDLATEKRALHTLTGHEGHVRAISWSSDSQRVVTGSLDNAIRVFDVETGALVCEPLTGHTDTLTAVAFRSSSLHHDEEVLSASLDGTARVWKLRKKIVTETRSLSKHHRDWIFSVDISPVDNCIASGGDDGKLVVVDATTGRVEFSLDAHKYWIRCITYSPDGTMIATCSDDRTISVWNADDGSRLVGPFNCDAGAVLSVAFSPDGNALVSGNDDYTVRSWTLDAPTSGTLGPLSTYFGHAGPVQTVAYARMGEWIISGSDDTEIAAWEGRSSNKLVRKFCGHDGAILSIAASGERMFSSSDDKTIRVWDLDMGDLRFIIRDHSAPVNEIRISQDGNWIVSASDDAQLRIWDAQTGESRTLPRHMPSRILSVAASHDGSLVACGGADGRVHICPDIARPVVWPDSFNRETRGLEYCPVDDQGILAHATLRRDGWLGGSMGEAMCWIPPVYRRGLLMQRTVGFLGVPEVALDMKQLVHGTNWEKCAADHEGA